MKAIISDFFGVLYIDGELNEELLAYFTKIKNEHDLYIFTNYTFSPEEEAIKKRLLEVFRKIYTVPELGVRKEDPESFGILSKDIGYEPSELLFIDDTYENVESARKAGLQTIHFRSNEDLVIRLKALT